MIQPPQTLFVGSRAEVDTPAVLIVGRHAYRCEVLAVCAIDDQSYSLFEVLSVKHGKVAGEGGITQGDWEDAGYSRLYEAVEGMKKAWNNPLVHADVDVTVLRIRPAPGARPMAGRSAKSPDEIVAELRDLEELDDE